MSDREWERRFNAMLHTTARRHKAVVYRDANGWVAWYRGREYRMPESPFFWVWLVNAPEFHNSWYGVLRLKQSESE